MSTITEEPQTAGETIDTPPPPDPEDKAPITLTLFDKSIYNNPDKLELKFTGTVVLDLSDPNDVALIPDPNGSRSYMVEVSCGKQSWAFDKDEDGNVSGATLQNAVTVHTVYKPSI